MNKIKFNDIYSAYTLDSKSINEIYNKVFGSDISSYDSFSDFSRSIGFLVSKYIYFNDLLHSNNLMQWFRTICLQKKQTLPIWYKYYSIKIYSKRTIKYYLDNPQIFWNTVYDIANNTDNESDIYIEKIDSLLVDVLDFYKKQYVMFPEFLKTSLMYFIRYYETHLPSYSESVDAHIHEIETLLGVNNPLLVGDAYKKLPSQNIALAEDIIDEKTPDDQDALNKVAAIEEEYYGDIVLNDDEDSRRKIMIIGDDKFTHKVEVMYAIARSYNIHRDQIEIYNDYDRITNEGERIISKTQHSEKYIGIIFGSLPHSTTGNDGYDSLISRCETEPGFPPYVMCKSNNNSGKPKITKGSFRQAIRELLIKYKAK